MPKKVIKEKVNKEKLEEIRWKLDVIGSNCDHENVTDFSYDIRKLQEAVTVIVDLLEEMNNEKARSR